MFRGEQRGRTRGTFVSDVKRQPMNFRLVTRVCMPPSSSFVSQYFHCPVSGDNWIDVTLDEFADCDSNLAANRQARMLADLALVNCYNKSSMPLHERNRLLLASAKRNLAGEFDVLSVSLIQLTQRLSSTTHSYVILRPHGIPKNFTVHFRRDLQPQVCHTLRAAQLNAINASFRELNSVPKKEN